MKKAAIYTRYSTDRQRRASTDDQIRKCQTFATGCGFEVVETFSDEELSGTSQARPAYKQMLDAAEKQTFDVLLIDDLSRLARDATEQGRALRRLKFLDIRIVGVSEGYDSDAPGEKIHAGIKGLMNELFVDNIRFQTKRGLEGRVLKGMSAGGRAYGYDSQPVLKSNTNSVVPRPEDIEGYQLKINDEQARVVRRIHQMFADGYSPMAIAAKLNEEGVPSPRNGTWARSAIHGDPRDGTGILNNALYDGRLVWNRASYVKDPDTGKTHRKVNNEEDWVIVEVPHLRVVPEELWAKVKARQEVISCKSKQKQATEGKKARTGAGPKYLLSGLLKCAECGANYIVVDRSRYGCAKHKDRGPAACSNGLKIKRTDIERSVVNLLKKRLLTKEAMEVFRATLKSEADRQLGDAFIESDMAGKRLRDVTLQISRLVDSIKAGIDPTLVADELNRLRQERDSLEQVYTQSKESAPVASDIIAEAIRRYESVIAHLEVMLMHRVPEAREILKALFGGEIQLTPTESGSVEAKMAGVGAGLFSLLASTPGLLTQSQINVVAGAGLEPATFGL